jgi:hypothetical protein
MIRLLQILNDSIVACCGGTAIEIVVYNIIYVDSNLLQPLRGQDQISSSKYHNDYNSSIAIPRQVHMSSRTPCKS